MFDVASASAVFTTLTANVSSLIGSTLTTLVGILAALLGLGFAIRHVKKWITGRKA